MKVFITGGSGFIGSETVKQLLQKGHSVIALARSDSSAEALKAAGCEIVKGGLQDVDAIAEGAKKADGAIHLAFMHDFFSDPNPMEAYARAAKVDQGAIKAIGDTYKGTNKPFVCASGYSYPSGVLADENTEAPSHGPGSVREASNILVSSYKDQGVKAQIIRIPPIVHDVGDKAFATTIIAVAKKNGFVAQVGEGENQWLTVHRSDVAALFILAAEKGKAGGVYHSHSEEFVLNEFYEFLQKHLDLPIKTVTPEEAMKYLGFIGNILAQDKLATNEITKKELGYSPKGIKLFEDLELNYL